MSSFRNRNLPTSGWTRRPHRWTSASRVWGTIYYIINRKQRRKKTSSKTHSNCLQCLALVSWLQMRNQLLKKCLNCSVNIAIAFRVHPITQLNDRTPIGIYICWICRFCYTRLKYLIKICLLIEQYVI